MNEPRFDPAHCAVCRSADAKLVFEHRGRAFTSDGRTLDKDIQKVQCCVCGAVRRGNVFDREEYERHYATEYQLASRAAVAEPLFYSEAGVVPRSQAIAHWLHQAVMPLLARPPASVIEVGCGEGSVMARLARSWPHARIEGLDPGATASVPNVQIRRGSYVDVASVSDLIYSFAVIEHVASPCHFLSVLSGALMDHGLLAVALPRLDAGARDLFFYDHLHHLQPSHLSHLARSAGLMERARANGTGALGDFMLHIFQKSHGKCEKRSLDRAASHAAVEQTVASWRRRWQAVDDWLVAQTGIQIVVWGLGEAFGLFRTYSRLGDHPIAGGVDDNPERFSRVGLPFPVCRLEDLSFADDRRPLVLLTFTPGRSAIARLGARQLGWFDAISGESRSC